MATLLDLAVRLEMDDEVSGKLGKVTKNIKSKLGGAAKVAGKAMLGMTAAAAGGVVALGKAALDAYAEYEQLVGGVEKLYGTGGKSFEEFAKSAADSMYEFNQSGEEIKRLQEELIAAGYDVGKAGADGIYGPETKAAFEAYARDGGALVQQAYQQSQEAARILQANAEEAYKTAGVDANTYMQTVTTFSAALINSLGGDTVAAAQLADVAMRDMSDNANTFGSDIETIQNAYQGFAKGNFTMLDNLNLGFSGSQEGMEALIAKAEELSGLDLSIDSFDDIVTAIHIVQEDMGIAGTTANEAATTIQGAFGMTQAAWTNLMIEMGKEDGNVGEKAQQVVESALTLMLGAIDENGEQLSGGVLGKLGEIFTSLAEALPGMMPMITAALEQALPVVMNVLSIALPPLLESFTTVIAALASQIPPLLSTLLPVLLEMVPQLLETGLTLFLALVQALNDSMPEIQAALTEMFAQVISFLVENGPALLLAAGSLFVSIVTALTDAREQVFAGMGEMFAGIAADISGAVAGMLAGAGEFFGAIVTAVTEKVPEVLAGLGEMIAGIATSISTAIPAMLAAAGEFFGQIVTAITEKGPEVLTNLGTMIAEIASAIMGAVPGMLAGAGELIGQVPTAIGNAIGEVTTKIGEVVTEIMNGFGPSTVSDLLTKAGEVIAQVPSAIGNAITDVTTKIGEVVSEITSPFDSIDLFSVGASIIQGLIDGIGSLAQGAIDAVGGIIQGIADLLPHSPAKKGPFSGKGWTLYSGRAIMSALAEGIDDTAREAENATADAVQGVYDAASGTIDVGVAASSSGPILTALNAILAAIPDAVYLDSKVLVGNLATEMDYAMGGLI